ncbi:MAG: 2Fe-2S iron-sulfur cluster-binding protein [Candidatus Nitricoxidivorans perseverans]|uniref:2Fe-2S iron-sulfur cluster-binding protein n=1 Tax=Candidatus Nitricoxidivorans perseverans TaxID=2975601 RepID=A0AA49FKL3_9PROT|nr:MAG: 2Fe-2S iron-sulfur cluster-binding protein [Candidatus Nitricoxidivorans perseverans]
MTPPEMTSASLLLWIVLGITLQLALWLAISFWRHWGEYQALRTDAGSGGGMVVPVKETLPSASEPASVAAWSGFRNFRVDRKEIEDGAQSICSFYLVPEDKQPLPAFKPGQFLTFRLDVPTHDGKTEQITRCYSLSDAPRTGFYRVSIKRVPAPAGSAYAPGRSSNYFHDHIQVGDQLQVRAPGGHFHIDCSDAPVVLIGGGIGITPVLSMLNWCVAEQPGREVWLYYGVRNSSEPIKRSHLEALAATYPNIHLRLCFSDPMPGDQLGRDYHHQGRVDVALFRAELPLKPYHFYICGPTPMMESLVIGLEGWGVPKSRIHYEAFGPASIKRSENTTGVEPVVAIQSDIVVTFAKSGKQIPWQPGTGSLLDFAEANGVKVDSSCRAGSCGCCQTTIKTGEVAYGHAPDFDPEPGNCLLCSCTPKTSVTLEA